MIRVSLSLSIFLLLGLFSLISACREPTQIVLSVRTDLNCHDPSSWQGMAIYVGTPGSLTTNYPTVTSSVCGEGGEVGTLVLTPSGARDESIAVRVVAGIGRQPSECDSHANQGCIEQQRTFQFSPYRSVDAQILLLSDCLGVICDADHTCVYGACSDTTPAVAAAGGLTVRCGDNGVRCPLSGDVCCLAVDVDAGTTSGSCRPSHDCPPANVVLACDDEDDCFGEDDAGNPNVCCLSYLATTQTQTADSVVGTMCLSSRACLRNGDLGMCQRRHGCLNDTKKCEPVGGLGSTSALPGYFACILD